MWRSWQAPAIYAYSTLRHTHNEQQYEAFGSDEEINRAVLQFPNLHIGANIREAILDLFSNLQFNHGGLLTSHALSFLTLSQSGLTEGELLDLLSLDDDVLRDTFQHHLPSLIRMPQHVWTRLKGCIGSFLTTREEEGVPLFFWFAHGSV
ncbi:unnamed protein product [Protopolystoma xenopodis]|uniref:NWD1/2-like winged helix-turn-helix domain-containing protein n=1 Tax=Protopolystoma xenopodis TaxID=117903 RepID=A0A3S5AW22_9PLAT|nr:unnamed protein product [Protopolystoma xenopodis]